MSKLTDLIRAKYPGNYDDMDDTTLEKSILSKHPEYKDLTTSIESKFEPKVDTGPSEQGLLSKGWNAISQPLTDIPSRFTNQVSEYINPERTTLGLKGIGSAGIESLGNVISELSSPLNLGTAALSGGTSLAAKAGLPMIAEGLNIGSKLTGAGMATHGANQVYFGKTLPEKLMGGLEIVGGIVGMRSKVPSIEKSVSGKVPISNESNIKFSTPTETKSKVFDPKTELMNYKKADLQRIENRPEGMAYNHDTGQIEPIQSIKEPNISNNIDEQLNSIQVVDENRPNVSGESSASQPKSEGFPIGTKVIIKSGKTSPESVKKARVAGYEFDGLTDEGHFRFKKTGEPNIEQPILESEVGQSRPRIGPNIDEKKSNIAAEVMNFPRTVMASMDMSAPLRQGIGLIHKKQFWTSFDDMFKAWGSEEAYNQVQQSIAEKPLFKSRAGPNGTTLPSFAQDAGLKLTDLTDLSRREESLMSSWAEKVPGVRRSNRAYTAFLNKLRSDTFESLIEQGKVFGSDGTTNIPLARGLADFINTATGRGSLGKLESSAVALNSTFFAPRLIASRLKILNPAYYVMAQPMVRQEALKSLFAIAGTGMAVGQLAKMAGAHIESDATSSDFGKIKIGNTRVDPFAGFQQYVVAVNKLVQGKTKSSTTGNTYNLGEKFGRQTRLDVVERFAESKLTPVLSFATGILRGKDFTGQPFNIPEEVASRFVPIFLQDLKQLATENPNLIPGIHKEGAYQAFHPENLPMAIPSWFGAGVQNYQSR